jgi:uncharacterized integral membrane protein
VAEDGVRGREISAKHVVVALLVLVVVVLAIANSKKVRVDFVVGDVDLPLFLVIVGGAVIGWIVGWFAGRIRD